MNALAKALILSFMLLTTAEAQRPDYREAMHALDLKMRCLKELSLVNYLRLYDSEFSDNQPGYLKSYKEEMFGSSLSRVYAFCGCVIEEAMSELGIAYVSVTMESAKFWREVVPKYISTTGDGSCPHDFYLDPND